jgi:hypothetical protein
MNTLQLTEEMSVGRGKMPNPTPMKAKQALNVSYSVAEDVTAFVSQKGTLNTTVVLSMSIKHIASILDVQQSFHNALSSKDFSIVNFELIFFPSQRTLEFSSEQVGPSAETPHTTTASSKVNRLIPFRLSHLPHPPDTMTVHPMHVVSPD